MTYDFKQMFKSAETLGPVQAQTTNAVVRDVARSLVAGLGIGAAGAGAAQLGKMWNRSQRKDESPYPTVLTTPMPFPAEPKLAFIRFGRRKPKPAKKNGRSKRADSIFDKLLPHYHTGDQAPFFADSSVSNPQSVPSYWPGVAMAAGAGLYGGYKGLSSIFNADDKNRRQQDLDTAKHEFEQALLSSYPKPKATVAPSIGTKLGMVLDALYDAIGAEKAAAFVKSAGEGSIAMMASQVNGNTPFSAEGRVGRMLERTRIREEKKHPDGAWATVFGFGGDKKGFDVTNGQDWANAWGQGKGLYGLYALGTGGLAAAATYNAVRSGGQDKTMDAVMKAHHRAQYAQSPTQILAVPKPIFAGQGDAPADDGVDPQDLSVAA